MRPEFEHKAEHDKCGLCSRRGLASYSPPNQRKELLQGSSEWFPPVSSAYLDLGSSSVESVALPAPRASVAEGVFGHVDPSHGTNESDRPHTGFALHETTHEVVLHCQAPF